MSTFKLGVIVGSNRRESINRRLAQALVRLGGDQFETKFLQIDDLPLFNQDFENPVPAPVARFKAEVEASDAVLFVTPEHNRSIPAALKNAIDWGGRPWGKTSWPGKPAAVTGTSAGAMSSAIAQQHLKTVLANQGLHILGGEAYILFKPDLIDAQGNVTDDSVRAFLKNFIDQFINFATRFAPERAKAAA
jgi:chromate reductase